MFSFLLNLHRNSCKQIEKPHLVASELGLHCLDNTPKWVSGLKSVKVKLMHSPVIFSYHCRPVKHGGTWTLTGQLEKKHRPSR